MERSVRIIPSNDSAFRRHVERLAAQRAFETTEELAARLRQLFPRVAVRASEVSGQENVWYVYRDGVWQSSADPRWWADGRTPRVAVTTEGWIEEANAPARAILGLGPSDVMPRFFTDFVAPGTLQDATELFAVVAAGHELSATTLVRPANGETIACDLRAWTVDGRIFCAFRLADDLPIAPPVVPSISVDLVCEPASDVVFGRYAREALDRMPEPTPDGLAIRLRRLYPHARVEANGGMWRAFRDVTTAAEPAAEWWRADGLPLVHYDTQGRILEANDAARAALGPDLVGQHWQDLVTAGTTEQVSAVMRMIADAGWAVSRFRMPGPDGYLFEFDSYTEVSGETFVTIMKPTSPAEG